MVHAFQLLFKNDCNYPIAFAYFIGAHALMFYFLFSGFYKSTYAAKERKAAKKLKADSDAAAAKETTTTLLRNGHATKQMYEKSSVLEDSYSTSARQRGGVFNSANGWICQPVHIN